MSQTDNKRIAKNAIALYFRTFITMLIGLYTSRVILQALGVVDYGIYNVVGGFVSMFSLISGSLTGSIGRYITFELGKGDIEKLRRVFSTSIYVVLGLSLLVFIATETIGLWYFYNKMVIPPDRMDAAFWVFQISVFTFILSLINMPYAASIIAHERMDIYAYLSIYDAVCKLLICYLVMHSPMDRLIYYALLFCLVGVIDQCISVIFCKRHFKESHFKLLFDKTLFQGMFSFAGWNFIGSSAAVLRKSRCKSVVKCIWRTCCKCSQWYCKHHNRYSLWICWEFHTSIYSTNNKTLCSWRIRIFDELANLWFKIFILPAILIVTPCNAECPFHLKNMVRCRSRLYC